MPVITEPTIEIEENSTMKNSFAKALLPNYTPYEVIVMGTTEEGEITLKYHVSKEIAVRIINLCMSGEKGEGEQLKFFSQDGEAHKVPETTL